MKRRSPTGKNWDSFSFGFSLGSAGRPLKVQYDNHSTPFLSGYRCGLASRGMNQAAIDDVMVKYWRPSPYLGLGPNGLAA